MKTQFEIEQTKVSTFWLQRKDGKYDGLHFMDDFGFLVPIDFKALAIHLQEEGAANDHNHLPQRPALCPQNPQDYLDILK